MAKKNLYSSILLNASMILVLLLSLVVMAEGQASQTRKTGGNSELDTARYFESVRRSPPQMMAFLRKMPKGADLHNHLSGAVYAESYVQWAAEKGLCVDQMTAALATCSQSAGQVPASKALSDPSLYRKLIDAWSMRNWQYSGDNAHDHFFDAFGKFGSATSGQTGQMLAEVTSRAARGGVLYLELMLTPDGRASSQIGQKIGWDGDFRGTINKLKSGGIDEAAATGAKAIQDAENEKNKLLKCGTQQADAGCFVTVRYIAAVARAAELGPVFAQMVTSFALANDPNSKVVAINLLQPEDWLPAMQNFTVQMEMLNFLRPLYPNAHISLHAGELAPGLVPPEGITFHIRESIAKGKAERIGHGVSILSEDNPYELLEEMARQKILVEICLTSNDTILGVKKERHPLAVYLQYGVPVSLATDDEGVSRSDISREYLKAAEDHGLGYTQLKTIARNGLQYAFLPGTSLWSDAGKFISIPQCSKDISIRNLVSDACKEFLEKSEKARLQWKLEEAFTDFEKRYSR